jgi:hypothetical protein
VSLERISSYKSAADYGGCVGLAGSRPLRVEITSGDLFHIEFAGKLHLTRMKFPYSPRRGYYTVDGYPLRDGLRAAIGEHG